MRVVEYRDARAFADRVAPLLAADPVGMTTLATVLGDVVAGGRDYPDSRWLAVESAGTVVAAAMHTPPHLAWLGPMPAEAAAAVAQTLASLSVGGRDLPGFAGSRPAVEALAERWHRLRPHDRLVEVTAMRLFRLGDLVPPAGVPGTARLAGAADRDLLVTWVAAFADEVGGRFGDPAESVALRLSGRGALLLWEVDGRPTSLAGVSPSAAGVARIGPVYTPAEHRGRGYGSAVTAAASRLVLDGGAHGVCLFIDLANPTSNSIYQRLGYRPRGDYVEVERAIG